MICNEKFDVVNYKFLQTHRELCEPPHLVRPTEPQVQAILPPPSSFSQTDNHFNHNDQHPERFTSSQTSHQPQSINSTHQTGVTVSSFKPNTPIVPISDEECRALKFKRITVTKLNGKIVRGYQCLRCSKEIRLSLRRYLFKHREICKIPAVETLISTNTIPTAILPDRPNEYCFICNVSGSASNYIKFDTKSMHTNKPIHEIINTVSGDKPSNRNLSAENSKWNQICLDCYRSINDFDLASSTAQQLKSQLANKLAETEKIYEKQANVEEDDESECFVVSDHNSIEDDERPIQNDEIIESDQQQVQEPQAMHNRTEKDIHENGESSGIEVIRQQTNDEDEDIVIIERNEIIVEVDSSEEEVVEVKEEDDVIMINDSDQAMMEVPTVAVPVIINYESRTLSFNEL